VSPGAHTADAIAQLDSVSGNFFELEKQPVIAALLAAEGDAVEPLIDVLERDPRTSRVEFDREHEFEKIVYAPVYRLAYWILERVIDTGYFVSSNAEHRMWRDPAGRKQVAAEIRAEWAKWGKHTRAERWYATLADDDETPEHWMAAANKIFEWVPNPHAWTAYDVADRKPLQGASLRARTHPSVTELVEKRLPVMAMHEACELVRLLGRWDRPAALSLGARLMTDAIAKSGTTTEYSACVWVLAIVRWKLGDDVALDDYAAWLANLSPPTGDYWDRGLFDPMIDNALRPSMVAAADKLFGAGSSWLPFIPDAPGPGVMARSGLLETRIYRVPAFQRYALSQLADTHVLGQIDVRSDRGWGYHLTNGMNMSTRAEPDAKDFPAQPTPMPLRACDFYAYFATRFDSHAPAFALYWDEAHRDRAIVEVAAWLRTVKP
jgi:hypothetical protein